MTNISTSQSTLSSSEIALNRIEFISICDELDIKGKYSGKICIFLNGKAQDILGIFLIKKGYIPRDSETCSELKNNESGYQKCRDLLAINRSELISIYREIDDKESTNTSIKNTIKRIFDKAPICSELCSP